MTETSSLLNNSFKNCKVQGCKSECKSGYSLCNSHICKNCNCLKHVSREQCNFCDYKDNEFNRCIITDCNNLCLASGYCNDHTCHYKNCNWVCLRNSKFCEAHVSPNYEFGTVPLRGKKF